MSASSAGEPIAGIVLLLLIAPLSCAWAEFSCSSRAEKMGFKSDWGPMQGCMVKTKDRWLPIESLREIDP